MSNAEKSTRVTFTHPKCERKMSKTSPQSKTRTKMKSTFTWGRFVLDNMPWTDFSQEQK